MDRVEALEFARQIVSVSNSIEQISQYDVRVIDNSVVKIRLYLAKGRYVDVFYNEDSGRIAYALIQKGKRLFGADNTGGWHIHPFDNPGAHISSGHVSFIKFQRSGQIATSKILNGEDTKKSLAGFR